MAASLAFSPYTARGAICLVACIQIPSENGLVTFREAATLPLPSPSAILIISRPGCFHTTLSSSPFSSGGQIRFVEGSGDVAGWTDKAVDWGQTHALHLCTTRTTRHQMQEQKSFPAFRTLLKRVCWSRARTDPVEEHGPPPPTVCAIKTKWFAAWWLCRTGPFLRNDFWVHLQPAISPRSSH